MLKKSILCFGDSNTYGYNPENGLRYSKDERWPGILANLLGNDFDVIEEGCNGRTAVFKDSDEIIRNGKEYIKPCLTANAPIDVVIIMLGSNDLKSYFNASPRDIALGVGAIIDMIKAEAPKLQAYVPEIILVSPTHIGPSMRGSPFAKDFDEIAISNSKMLSSEYKIIAEEKNVKFFDAAEVATASALDALHLTRESHKALAAALKDIVCR